MVQAFSFAHSIEVLFAKISLRQARSGFLQVVESVTRPKDNRAVSLLRSRFVQRLNKFNRRLTTKKAFFRWYLHSHVSVPRLSIEKIAINARINHLIATYRFIRIARIGLARDKKHKHLYEGLELTDNLVNKLYDKYNTRLTILEQAFSRIKDNYIRCSRLLRLESVIAKIIERQKWKSLFFENTQRISKIKTRLITKVVECCRTKTTVAFDRLRTRYHDYMSSLTQHSKTQTDFQIIQKIFENKYKQHLSDCLRRVAYRRERAIEAHDILQGLFNDHLRRGFKLINNKKTNTYEKLHSLVSLLEKIKRRHLTMGQEAITQVIEEEETETITVRSPTAATPSSATMIRFLGPGTPGAKAAGFSGFLTRSQGKRPEIVPDHRRKAFDSLIRTLRRLEYKRKSAWWLVFEIFARIKKYREAKNFFRKWAIKMFGERAKFKWNRAAKIMKFNHIVRTTLFRHSIIDMKKSIELLHLNAFLDHQLKKPVSFKNSIPMIKLLISLTQSKKKQGLYAISFVSEISKSLTNISILVKGTTLTQVKVSDGGPAVEVPQTPTSPTFQKMGALGDPTVKVSVKVDQVAAILQSQRVRRREVNPIMTNFDQVDSPRHRKQRKAQNPKSRSVSRDRNRSQSQGFGGFAAASDPQQSTADKDQQAAHRNSKYSKLLLQQQTTDNVRQNVYKAMQKEDTDFDCIRKKRNANMMRDLRDYNLEVLQELPKIFAEQEVEVTPPKQQSRRKTQIPSEKVSKLPPIDTGNPLSGEPARNMFARKPSQISPTEASQGDQSQSSFGPNFGRRSSKGAETIRIALESLGDRAKDIMAEARSNMVSPGPINPIVLSPNGARSREVGKNLKNGLLNLKDAANGGSSRQTSQRNVQEVRHERRKTQVRLTEFEPSESGENEEYNVYEAEDPTRSVPAEQARAKGFRYGDQSAQDGFNPRESDPRSNFVNTSSSMRASPKQPERKADADNQNPSYRRQNSGVVTSPNKVSSNLPKTSVPQRKLQLPFPAGLDSQDISRKVSGGDDLMHSWEHSPGKMSGTGTNRLPEPKVSQSVDNWSQSKGGEYDGQNSQYGGDMSMGGSSRRVLQVDPQPVLPAATQKPPANLSTRPMGSKITAAMALLNSKPKPK